MGVFLTPDTSVCQVADPEKNTQICDIMMSRYNIYVQAINYPTVAKGEELLRIAPTPHHTPQMMLDFVGTSVGRDVASLVTAGPTDGWFFFSSADRLVQTWKEVGLQPTPRPSAECRLCQQPLHFELMSDREKSFFAGLGHLIPAVA